MPIPEKSRTINRVSMKDKVYETLLEWIIQGELKPGEKILDKELAENLGVSRTPIREALNRLEDKKMVESSAGRWTRVAEISRSEAELFYPIIWTLEKLAISMAIDLFASEDLKIMDKANQDLKRAIKSGDPIKASKADADFHGTMIKKSNNQYLTAILNDLKIKHRWMVACYFGQSKAAFASVDEHDRILSALKAKNQKMVENGLVDNWKNSMNRMISITSKD